MRRGGRPWLDLLQGWLTMARPPVGVAGCSQGPLRGAVTCSIVPAGAVRSPAAKLHEAAAPATTVRATANRGCAHARWHRPLIGKGSCRLRRGDND
ncbi:hypothetical protein BHE74_00034495 [Ensete ventricosum]|nr:hypothetical protein BHE74_00034495 [Ensete ventricosum]